MYSTTQTQATINGQVDTDENDRYRGGTGHTCGLARPRHGPVCPLERPATYIRWENCFIEWLEPQPVGGEAIQIPSLGRRFDPRELRLGEFLRWIGERKASGSGPELPASVHPCVPRKC
jgi:hypothetical protein